MKFKTFARGIAALAVVGGLYGLYVWQRTRWIPAGHVGVIYDASRGLLDEVYKPQAITVGWRQQLYVYPTKLENAVYTQDPTAGEVRAADGILVTTNDNANTVFDVSVLYRVRSQDVRTMFEAFGPIPIEEVQSLHLRRAVKEAANAVSTRYDLFSLMGPKREEASRAITIEMRNRLQRKGITVVHAMLGGCYPSDDFQSKITARVNAYIDLEISRLKQEIAEIERQSAVVQGEAESSARGLQASQTKDRSMEMLKLDAAKAAVEKWNGQLPAISPRPGQTIVLTPGLLEGLSK